MPIAEYGYWESPISPEQIAAKFIEFQEIVVDGDYIYCAEMRPLEKGRYAIVQYSPLSDSKQTVLPEPFSARTLAHEYGGRGFTVADGIIYFVNYADQNLYKIEPQQQPQQITTQGIRFAELIKTKYGMVAIAEQHAVNSKKVENFLALIEMVTGEVTKLHSGYDFYAAPSISNTGKVAWLCWNNPNMPWQETHIFTAELLDGKLYNPTRILQHVPAQAYFQPQWDEADNLYFISDLSGWSNFYSYSAETDSAKNICPISADFAKPLWRLGISTWGFYRDKIICTYMQNGAAQLALLDLHKEHDNLHNLPLPFAEITKLCMLKDGVCFVGGSPTKAASLVLCSHTGEYKILAQSYEAEIDQEHLSLAQHLQFATHSRQKIAYAFYYPPCNPDFQAPVNTKPPLLLIVHGGPTTAATSTLKLEVQFWTSRGFAVACVNYGGSTDYGREYRRALERDSLDSDGHWGDVDVKDCVACVEHLVAQNLVDPSKIFIRGGSAGGFTTLAALTSTKVFTAGTSCYGICDLAAMAHDTHKFEARYLDGLLGALPKFIHVYTERSPINHIKNIKVPLLVLQGDEDPIVPPNQAELLVNAMRKNKQPVEYVLYQGEKHGFKKAETIIDMFTRELAFYRSVMALEPMKKKDLD